MNSVVPNGWDSKRLGDVASLIMGQSPTSDTYNDEKNGTPFFQGKADFGVKYPKVRYWCTSPTKIAPIDSILFSVRAPVGAVNLNNIEACIGRGLASISGKSIDNTFLYQSLIHAKVKFEALGQGSTFEAINGNELKEFSLVCPPLPEQKKIASILTSVDEVIENTQKQIDKLQDLKKATMNELLTKGIGHTEFKDSELGRIPVSWEVKKLNELCSPTSPITYGVLKPGNYIEGGIPLLQVKDLKDGNVDKSDIHRISTSLDQEYARSRVRFHDILISLIGTVGRVSLMPKVTETYNIHRNIGRIRLENPEWVFLHLQSQKGVQQIQLASSGSSQSALNLSALKEFLISIPPLMEQSDIISIINSLSESLTTNYRKLHQTQSLKKSLMQDLLTGKVRVTVN